MGKEKLSPSYRLAEKSFTTLLRRNQGRDIFAENLKDLIMSLPTRHGISLETMEELLKVMRNANLIRLKTFRESHPTYPAGLTRVRVTQKGYKELKIPVRVERESALQAECQ